MVTLFDYSYVFDILNAFTLQSGKTIVQPKREIKSHLTTFISLQIEDSLTRPQDNWNKNPYIC